MSASRPIVEETVSELLATVRGLLKDEDERAASLNARASALTGFVGIIVSLAAGAAISKDAGSGLSAATRALVGVLFSGALVALAIAIGVVVGKVLLPITGLTIAMSEVRRYPTWDFIAKEHVRVQGDLLKGLVDALGRDRERNASKAAWLRRSYVLVCLGLALVASAGVAATIDRYVT